VLAGREVRRTDRIDVVAGGTGGKAESGEKEAMQVEETLEQLKMAVSECDPEGAARWAQQALDEGVEPLRALDALTVAIRQVGDAFGAGELFLPDLVGAADAMQSALPMLQAAFATSGKTREPLAP
jgi:methanogenic corrinoid protein MtbC1